MPINGYFDVVFASSGTRATVPDGVQSGGSVSYTQGYGVNYTLANTNPNYLAVEETKMNQLFYDITSAIQYFQQGNAAAFITTTMNGGVPYTYPQYAIVSYGGVTYQSNQAGNADTPPSSKWTVLNAANYLQISNNLSDLGSLSTALTNLGFTTSAGTNGYVKLPGGIIIQWGYYNGAGSATITFPLAFPNNCFAAVANAYVGNSSGGDIVEVSSVSKTALYCSLVNATTATVVTSGIAWWIAIGN